jgi:hypothetical protein
MDLQTPNMAWFGPRYPSTFSMFFIGRMCVPDPSRSQRNRCFAELLDEILLLHFGQGSTMIFDVIGYNITIQL